MSGPLGGGDFFWLTIYILYNSRYYCNCQRERKCRCTCRLCKKTNWIRVVNKSRIIGQMYWLWIRGHIMPSVWHGGHSTMTFARPLLIGGEVQRCTNLVFSRPLVTVLRPSVFVCNVMYCG